jgi:hypothetical protein
MVLTLNARSPTTNDLVTLAFVESLAVFADLQRIHCEPRTATQPEQRRTYSRYKKIELSDGIVFSFAITASLERSLFPTLVIFALPLLLRRRGALIFKCMDHSGQTYYDLVKLAVMRSGFDPPRLHQSFDNYIDNTSYPVSRRYN